MNRVTDFEGIWKEYTDEDNDHLIVSNEPLMEYLKTGGFFTAPASTKYHGVYEGGLYDHSKAVFNRLQWMTINLRLNWQRSISPFIIGFFHDLCKCDQYIEIKAGPPELGLEYETPVYQYNPNLLLKGHGEKSVMILSQFMTLTEEEMLCIRYHMGAYEKDDWDGFDRAIKKYPNVLMAHTADMFASKVDGT